MPDAALAVGGRHGGSTSIARRSYNHNAIEPHATIAVWRTTTALTVYDTTQSVIGVRRSARARLRRSKSENVRVLAPFVGGGFGGKGGLWSTTVLCAAAAQVVHRPVRIALTREQVFRTGRRPHAVAEQRVALGADATGSSRRSSTTASRRRPTHARFAGAIHLSGAPSVRDGDPAASARRSSTLDIASPTP